MDSVLYEELTLNELQLVPNIPGEPSWGIVVRSSGGKTKLLRRRHPDCSDDILVEKAKHLNRVERALERKLVDGRRRKLSNG